MRFRQQFLITYRSFTTPVQLLEKLRERFHLYSESTAPMDPVERTEWERHRKLLQLRVLTVLSRWLGDLFEDFSESSDLRTALLSFLDEVQPTNVSQLGNQLRATFTSKWVCMPFADFLVQLFEAEKPIMLHDRSMFVA